MEEKVTLITTVKNEEISIGKFLDSILRQTKRPDEIIIVDAHSNDKTPEIIQKLKVKVQNYKLKFKTFRKKGNRSLGRNLAISKSSNDIAGLMRSIIHNDIKGRNFLCYLLLSCFKIAIAYND